MERTNGKITFELPEVFAAIESMGTNDQQRTAACVFALQNRISLLTPAEEFISEVLSSYAMDALTPDSAAFKGDLDGFRLNFRDMVKAAPRFTAFMERHPKWFANTPEATTTEGKPAASHGARQAGGESGGESETTVAVTQDQQQTDGEEKLARMALGLFIGHVQRSAITHEEAQELFDKAWRLSTLAEGLAARPVSESEESGRPDEEIGEAPTAAAKRATIIAYTYSLDYCIDNLPKHGQLSPEQTEELLRKVGVLDAQLRKRQRADKARAAPAGSSIEQPAAAAPEAGAPQGSDLAARIEKLSDRRRNLVSACIEALEPCEDASAMRNELRSSLRADHGATNKSGESATADREKRLMMFVTMVAARYGEPVYALEKIAQFADVYLHNRGCSTPAEELITRAVHEHYSGGLNPEWLTEQLDPENADGFFYNWREERQNRERHAEMYRGNVA